MRLNCSGRWVLARLLAAIAVCALHPPGALAQTAPAPPRVSLTLEEAVARGLAANARHLSRELDLTIAAADIDVAREVPNPTFTYESTRDAPNHAFVFSVPVETAGKRGRRVASGDATRGVVEADLARDTADLRSDIRRAFYRLAAADRRSAVTHEIASEAARVRDAAQARVESGDAPRLDLVQAELALARVKNLAATVDAERSALEDELDVLIGLVPGTGIAVAGDPFTDGLSQAATMPAGANGVDLVAADRRVAAANAGVDLAKALRTPDLALEAGLTYHAPPDFTYGWKAGFTLSLPIFTTHRAGLVHAEQFALQATREATAVRAEADGRTAAATARAGALADAVTRTTHDILPAADTVADMAQASYSAGQTGMVALLQSLQTVAETRLEAVETALSFQLALADLERARGAAKP